jgi:hypothetical protein
MTLAQCGAASCDWRATPAHEEAPARGEPGLGFFEVDGTCTADREAIRYLEGSTTIGLRCDLRAKSADRSRRPSARKREEAPRRNRTSVFEVSICGLMEPTGERPVVNTLAEPVALLPGELSVPKYRVTSSGAPGVCHWPLRGFFLDSPIW